MKYEVPIWQLIAKAADSLKKEVFTASDIVSKVHENHPEVLEITIKSYVTAMAPNHPFSWHWPSMRKNHPYLYHLGKGRYRLLKPDDKWTNEKTQTPKKQIKVLKNGPYLVSGEIPLFEMIIKCSNGTTPNEWGRGRKFQTPKQYILCRCGKTKTKPFCDGTHYKKKFDGTEASQNKPFEEMATVFEGPKLDLKDAVALCASARFCHRGGDIWEEIPKSDDPKARQNSIRNACDCPSGRLVVFDKEKGSEIEPLLEPSIGLVLDPKLGIEGPYWVRGGISVYSSKGKQYEVRNRMTLCRCGKSSNKPFCDSSHYPEEYQEVTKDERK